MEGVFSIELSNNTSNSVVANLFRLGANGLGEVFNSCVIQSDTIELSIPTSDLGVASNRPFFYSGDTSILISNENTFLNVAPSTVGLSIATSSTLNPPDGIRRFTYSTDPTIENLSPASNPYNLEQLSVTVENSYLTTSSANFGVIVNPITQMMYDGANYNLRLRFEVIFQTTENNSVLQSYLIDEFRFDTNFTSYTLGMPSSSASGNWINTYTLANGVVIRGLGGDDYGELLRGQVSNPMALNSLSIRPLESGYYDYSNRINQLLQSVIFTRYDVNGESDSYVLNPTVDLYQDLTVLEYVNLGTRTDDFLLDGSTNIGFQLLPYAKVNFLFYFVETSNFIFANKDLVKEIVELNRAEQKRVQELSKVRKTYNLDING